MTAHSSTAARIVAPLAALSAQPLQHSQMTGFGSAAPDGRVQRAPVGARPREEVQVAFRGSEDAISPSFSAISRRPRESFEKANRAGKRDMDERETKDMMMRRTSVGSESSGAGCMT